MASEEYFLGGEDFVEQDNEEISFEQQELLRQKQVVANIFVQSSLGVDKPKLQSQEKHYLNLKSVLAYKIAMTFHAYFNAGNVHANGIEKAGYSENVTKLMLLARGETRKAFTKSNSVDRVDLRKQFLKEIDLKSMIVNDLDFDPKGLYLWFKSLSQRHHFADGNDLNILDASINANIINAQNGHSHTHNVRSLGDIFIKLQEYFEPEIGLVGGAD